MSGCIEIEIHGTNAPPVSNDGRAPGPAPSQSTHLSDMKPTKSNGEHRKIPLLSEIAYFPVIMQYACIHWLLRFWPKLEGTIVMAIHGGYFGLFLIPVGFVWIAIQAMEHFLRIPSSWFLYGVVLPFSISYLIWITVFDQTKTVVENSGLLLPRNVFEQATMDCLRSVFPYHNTTCIPWSKDAKLDPTRQYVFGVHPHGIHCTPLIQFCVLDSEFDKRFPGIVGPKTTGIIASILFKIPIVREAFFHMGYIDASRKVCSAAMSKGQSLYIVTGGEEESMWTKKGQDIVVLKKRKGFVRLALSYGADLVPIFGAGNTDTYITYPFALKFRLWLQKKTGIALPIFHGRWFTPLPYPVHLRILVGEPIQTPKPKVLGAKPDDQLVDEYHAKYIQCLKEMHAKYVHDRTLIVK